MLELRTQVNQSLNLKEYNHRILVTGSVNCIDKKRFNADITSYINNLNEDVIFLTLDEKDGPENWITSWCKKFNYPCVIIEGDNDYDRVNKAGYLPSNILIFSKNEREFKFLSSIAKNHKTSITWVIVE